jgi:hypothetical protein
MHHLHVGHLLCWLKETSTDPVITAVRAQNLVDPSYRPFHFVGGLHIDDLRVQITASALSSWAGTERSPGCASTQERLHRRLGNRTAVRTRMQPLPLHFHCYFSVTGVARLQYHLLFVSGPHQLEKRAQRGIVFLWHHRQVTSQQPCQMETPGTIFRFHHIGRGLRILI